jgi:hypothetical protein
MPSCQKDVPELTAEDILANKTWYLEKHYTSSSTYLYPDHETFSFRVEKNPNSYSDSDGIFGTYTIKEQSSDLSLSVFSSGRLIDAYTVTQLENDYVVMEYSKNSILHTFYFTTH